MQYQQMDPDQLTEDKLTELRALYEEARDRQSRVIPWTRTLRRRPGDLLYAVAVRDENRLWLFLWIRRSSKGDYYVFFPRDDGDWNPHASYHRDGRRHQKSHDHRSHVTQRQKPDACFRGTENVLTTPITAEAVRAVKAAWDIGQFSDTFEIPVDALDRGQHDIAIDVVEPGGAALWKPSSRVVMEKRFTDAAPEILVTLWETNSE